MTFMKSALGAAIALYLGSALSTDVPPSTPVNPGFSIPRAVLSGPQVVQILDLTVDWYRTLGTQQQSSSQPSDLLIFYANQQTANQVIALAFDIARANAELLSSEASEEPHADDSQASAQTSDALHSKLQAQRQSIQAEMAARKQQLTSASSSGLASLQAKLLELQSELDMVNARLNLSDTLQQFVSASNSKTASANALKSHIDAIAASIPTSNAPAAAGPSATLTASNKLSAPTATQIYSSSNGATEQTGIWDLSARVLKLRSKASTIAAIDRSTAVLQETFHTLSDPPLTRLNALAAQSDGLATKADTASGPALKELRGKIDTLAWLFQQTSDIWVPLNKEAVLLDQYRHNLKNWRDAVIHEYDEALKELGVRLALLIGMLTIVFAGAEIWRRLVIRYTHDQRHRYQLLLIQKLTVWALVTVIIAITFVTQISTFATFAGLITAGLAVAMQSVLLSIVGYFFLIGKYGLRIGDRVQIGTVTGEVISLGLVRLHLLEINSQGTLGATGRVVAFANSFVFQAANGLFRQIPGVDFVWRDSSVSLPPGRDHSAIKAKLVNALNQISSDSQAEFARQSEQIRKTTPSASVIGPSPQVQLRYAASGVEVYIRYPVQRQHEAETEERVSRAIFEIVGNVSGEHTKQIG